LVTPAATARSCSFNACPETPGIGQITMVGVFQRPPTQSLQRLRGRYGTAAPERTLTGVSNERVPLEVDVWRGVRAGEAEAFVRMYESLADAVFGFCLRRTGDWSSAEDCTSLVFLEAWRLRTTLRDESAGIAWLFGVANNVVRNAARARRRHRALLSRLPLEETDVDHGFEADAVARLDAERRAGDLAKALSELPKAQRDVLALASTHGLGPAEISQVLKMPVGTVKSRLSRGRQRLIELGHGGESAALLQSR
jgi:RNA polymerase sigma-70 factor (ECF subfamily)